MNHIAKDILQHTGVLRRSGRYPWGSGEQPFQNVDSFLGHIKGLKDKGMEVVDNPDLEQFRNAVKSVYEKYEPQYGKELIQAILETK